PEQMREVGRGLELPAQAALDQAHATVRVVGRELGQRFADVGAGEMSGELLGGQRLFGSEQRCLDGPDELVGTAHAATRRKCSGPKVASCLSSALPSRASSSAATKLEASAERLSLGSACAGRKSRSSIQSSLTPSNAETRSSAASSVITMRSRTMCTTGSLRALTWA